MTKKKIQKNRGLTLLFAVLLSVLILAIGSSIISIALKQFTLSSAGRESHYAFYAANTGVECAIYWDLAGDIDNGGGVFATSSLSLESSVSEDVTCAGVSISDPDQGNLTYSDNGFDTYISDFEIKNFGDLTDACVHVVVEKTKDSDDVIQTKIISRGYNTCDVNNPRRVERGFELNY